MEPERDETGTLRARLPAAFPFRVGERAGAGRTLLANREIRPQETVLTDSAIILGETSGDIVVCLLELLLVCTVSQLEVTNFKSSRRYRLI
jgi:hypothetical protein